MTQTLLTPTTTKKLEFYLSDGAILMHFVLFAFAVYVFFAEFTLWMLAAFALGWVVYVVQEHLIHEHIFHMKAPTNQRWFNVLYRLHYGHHDQIHNLSLLFTPLWFSLLIGVANLAMMALVVPLPYAIVSVYGGGIAAYLVFEWLHLGSHFHTRDRSSYVMKVTQRHARHHFNDYANWFTVSPGGLWVDSILGTNPETLARRENARTCGLEVDDPRLVAARKLYPDDKRLARPFETAESLKPKHA